VTKDLLPAAGFMLASISLLFSSWYREMRDSAAEARPSTPDAVTDWQKKRQTQRRGHAIPLALALAGFVLIFTEVAFRIIGYAGDRLLHPSRWDDYDPLEAAFLLVWLIAVGMLAHAVRVYRSLRT
jgi:hypothetical protein